jgi:hypothetical protein
VQGGLAEQDDQLLERRPEEPPPAAALPGEHDAELIQGVRRTRRRDDARRAPPGGSRLCYEKTPRTGTRDRRWTRVEDTDRAGEDHGLAQNRHRDLHRDAGETDELVKIRGAGLSRSRSAADRQHRQTAAGARREGKGPPGTFEPACSPIAQAELCNAPGPR